MCWLPNGFILSNAGSGAGNSLASLCHIENVFSQVSYKRIVLYFKFFMFIFHRF